MIEPWPEATRYPGGAGPVRTRHAFSFAGHYDPANTGFGVLSACNEELLEPGAGFEEHPHRDTEIVTWVIEGTLEHRGGDGSAQVLGPGDVQRLSAAGGVRHSECNAGPGPLRFLQMWLHPDTYGGAPDYAWARTPAPPGRPGLVPLVSGRGPGAVLSLRQRAAALYAARPAGPDTRALPDAPFVYVHVLSGGVRLTEAVPGTPRAPGVTVAPGVTAAPGPGHVRPGPGQVPRGPGPVPIGPDSVRLGPGDAARVTDARGLRARTDGPAEYLVWEMHATPSYG